MIPLARVAPEGRPFILAAGGLALLVSLAWWGPFIWVAWAVAAAVAAFFRDPERVTPAGGRWVVSPADGRVLEVVSGETAPGIEGIVFTRISIFMSVTNVHVNRAPLAATVEEVVHHPGRFLPAYRDKASLANEQTWIRLQSDAGPVFMKQIAGVLARRIVCRVAAGDRLAAGERFGLIRFGSRVDLFVPPAFEVLARPGQLTHAGETILGLRRGPA